MNSKVNNQTCLQLTLHRLSYFFEDRRIFSSIMASRGCHNDEMTSCGCHGIISEFSQASADEN